MIVNIVAPSEVGLFTLKHGPKEPPHCKNCYQRWRHHTEGKCVFEASTYEPWNQRVTPVDVEFKEPKWR